MLLNDLFYGIDISQDNANIDFTKLAESKCSFVIIRAGEGPDIKDEKFEEFYTKATEANLLVGCYWNCRAKSLEETKKEIEAFKEVIKDKNFKCPCYYVIDDIKTSLRENMAKSTLTYMINEWCSEIKKLGFIAGFRTSYEYLNRFNLTEIDTDCEKCLNKIGNTMGVCSIKEWHMWLCAICGKSSESTRSVVLPGCDELDPISMCISVRDYGESEFKALFKQALDHTKIKESVKISKKKYCSKNYNIMSRQTNHPPNLNSECLN